MNIEKLRAFWFHKQGLDGSMRGQSNEESIQSVGWLRGVGGANAYIALFARNHSTRPQVDQDVKDLHIHELPAVRGCTYVVDSTHYRTALFAASLVPKTDIKTAEKLGFTTAQIESQNNAVLKALQSGPLDPKQLKEELQDVVAHFGAEGKKRGLTTSLSVSLGLLQNTGQIRRISTNGRLDQERYVYAIWNPEPVNVGSLTNLPELASLYASWASPFHLDHLCWFTGLSKTRAKAELTHISCDSLPDDADWYAPSSFKDQFEAFQIPQAPQIALVAPMDPFFNLRRDLSAILDPEDHQRPGPNNKPIATSNGLGDLENHAVLDRGRLVGLWDYDPDHNELVLHHWSKHNKEIEEKRQETEAMIKEELGDARTFSLDSPKSRQQRLEFLRALNR